MNQKGVIKRIKIEGFKSINKLDLELKPLNIIIGSNGVGKTNFINAFKFLNQIVNKNLQNYVFGEGGADCFLHFGSKITKEIKFFIDFNVNSYEINLAPITGDSLAISKEVGGFIADKIGYNGGPQNVLITNKYSNESNLPSSEKWSIAGHITKFLKGYKIYHFHDTSKDAKVKKTNRLNDNISLNTDASNLASMLYQFKMFNEYDYNKIVETIRLIAPYFKDFVLMPDENKGILPRWQHKEHETVFSFDDLSDGTLRFICLSTLLLQPLKVLPDTIIIDEPELGLHPHAISVLAGIMKSVSKQGKQIIASSQSVTLINEFKAEDILVSDLKNNETHIRRLEEQEIEAWLEDYKIGTIWEKNIIGGTPNDFQ